jgi:Ca2+-binding RTX toxin-like protein
MPTNELRVNLTTTGEQKNSNVTLLDNGLYLVTWEHSGGGVRGSILDSQGNIVKPEFMIHSGGLEPDATLLGNGTFAVTSYTASGSINLGIFNNNGVQINSISVNSPIPTAYKPSLTLLDNGNFVVAWGVSYLSNGVGFGDVYAQIIGIDGTKKAVYQVDTVANGSQYEPNITAISGGKFVTSWSSQGTNTGTFIQIINSNGVKEGEIQITNNPSVFPSIATLSNGNFVVAWKEHNSNDGDIFARIYNANGVPQGEILVNTLVAGGQGQPEIASVPSGGFVVAWESWDLNGMSDVYVRQFYNDGSPVNIDDIIVNTYTSNRQTKPSVAVSDDGTFTVSWTSYGQDGDKEGVYSRTFNLSIPPNAAPIATNDSFQAVQNTDLIISKASIIANDSDADGDTISITSISASSGTLVLNGDVYTYRPAVNFLGNDIITYTISDGKGGTSTATITVSVIEPNGAINDSVVTNEEQNVTFNILQNDINVSVNDAVSITTQATNGFVIYNGNGTVTYNPDTNFFGTDSFTYSVTDSQGETTTATVNITVNPVDDAPIANNDAMLAINEDTSLTFAANALIGNDVEYDGDVLTITNIFADNGTIIQNANGTYTYTPPLNYTDVDTIIYTINDRPDGSGTSRTATANIAVRPVNDLPVAVNDSFSTIEDTSFTFNILNNDTDIEDGQLPANGVHVNQANNGFVQYNSDGTVTYTTNANYNGNDSFTYTVTDSNGGASTATVNINVTAVNDAPYIQDAITDRITTLGSNFSYTFSDNRFVDVDVQPRIYTATLADGTALSSSWLNFDANTRTFSGTPNLLGAVSVKLNISDGSLSVNDYFDITVNASASVVSTNQITVNNTATTGTSDSKVAILNNGGYVVVWKSNAANGNTEIKAQRFNSSGVEQGSELVVNSITTGIRDNPNVAALSNGGFVVTWDHIASGDTDIHAQVYDGSFNKVFLPYMSTGEFVVNDTTGKQSKSTITPIANDKFIVSWTHEYNQTVDIQSKALNNNGTDLNALPYNTKSANIGVRNIPEEIDSTTFRASLNGIYGIVVTATQNSVAGSYFSSDGFGYDFEVFSNSNNNNYRDVSVASLSNGGFVVTWKMSGSAGTGLYGQLYSGVDDKNGGIFQISNLNNTQSQSDVAALDNGAFVVVYQDDLGGIYGQVFKSDATATGPKFQINNIVAGQIYIEPKVEYIGNNKFIVTWSGKQNAASVYNVFSKTFTASDFNQSPEHEKFLNDQVIDAGNSIFFQLHGNEFSDPDGDTLTYTAVLNDGNNSPLPNWLHFDGIATFTGDATFENAGTISIKVTASDGDKSVSDIFNLTVNTNISSGNDIVIGGSADDVINAGAGDDIIYAGSGEEIIDGGTGIDTVSYFNSQSGIKFDLAQSAGIDGYATGDNISNIELFEGSKHSDVISGSSQDDKIKGGNGDDTIAGQAGDDLLEGGNGIDIILGGNGADEISGNEGDDTIDGGFGDDIIYAGLGNDQIQGGGDVDTIYGEEGNDKIVGGQGNDILDGGSGDDLINGGDGNDDITGGAGNDQLHAGEGNDELSGGEGDDILVGAAGNNVLKGEDGNDTLFGGIGNNVFIGGSGNDVFVIEPKAGGFDVIQDFDVNSPLEKINLSYFTGISSITDLDIKQVGDHAVISFSNGQKVQLTNVNASEISDDNFTNAPLEARVFIIDPLGDQIQVIKGFNPENERNVIDISEFGIYKFDDLGIAISGSDTVVNVGKGKSIVLTDVHPNSISASNFAGFYVPSVNLNVSKIKADGNDYVVKIFEPLSSEYKIDLSDFDQISSTDDLTFSQDGANSIIDVGGPYNQRIIIEETNVSDLRPYTFIGNSNSVVNAQLDGKDNVFITNEKIYNKLDTSREKIIIHQNTYLGESNENNYIIADNIEVSSVPNKEFGVSDARKLLENLDYDTTGVTNSDEFGDYAVNQALDIIFGEDPVGAVELHKILNDSNMAEILRNFPSYDDYKEFARTQFLEQGFSSRNQEIYSDALALTMQVAVITFSAESGEYARQYSEIISDYASEIGGYLSQYFPSAELLDLSITAVSNVFQIGTIAGGAITGIVLSDEIVHNKVPNAFTQKLFGKNLTELTNDDPNNGIQLPILSEWKKLSELSNNGGTAVIGNVIVKKNKDGYIEEVGLDDYAILSPKQEFGNSLTEGSLGYFEGTLYKKVGDKLVETAPEDNDAAISDIYYDPEADNPNILSILIQKTPFGGFFNYNGQLYYNNNGTLLSVEYANYDPDADNPPIIYSSYDNPNRQLKIVMSDENKEIRILLDENGNVISETETIDPDSIKNPVTYNLNAGVFTTIESIASNLSSQAQTAAASTIAAALLNEDLDTAAEELADIFAKELVKNILLQTIFDVDGSIIPGFNGAIGGMKDLPVSQLGQAIAYVAAQLAVDVATKMLSGDDVSDLDSQIGSLLIEYSIAQSGLGVITGPVLQLLEGSDAGHVVALAGANYLVGQATGYVIGSLLGLPFLGQTIGYLISGSIIDPVIDAWDDIADVAEGIGAAIADTADTVEDVVQDTVIDITNFVEDPAEVINDVIDDISESVDDFFDNIGDWFGGWWIEENDTGVLIQREGLDDNPLLHGFKWSPEPDNSTVIRYTFDSSKAIDFEGVSQSTSDMTLEMKAAIIKAMALWSNVSNITFVEDNTASLEDIELVFAKGELNLPNQNRKDGETTIYTDNSNITRAEVFIHERFADFSDGSRALFVILHEIGHALGVDPHLLNKAHQSVMTNPGVDFDATPMIMDIQEAQELYGINNNFNNGDDVYQIDQAESFTTIWDGAGNDTINASSFTGDSIIDIRDGANHFIKVGQSNTWIAEGANIENILAGSGDDLLNGNDLSNRITTGGGTDIITGYAGNDVFVISQSAENTTTITDFNIINEILDLSNITNLPSFPSLDISDVNGNAMISLSNNQKIILQNVLSSDLTINNFVGVSVNYNPFAVADTASVFENGTIDIDVIANDTDADNDVLSIVSIDTSSATGLATIDVDGTVIYNTNGKFEHLSKGATATDSFTYTISDGNGGFDSETVTLTINGQNDAPSSLLVDNASFNENVAGAVIGNISFGDVDVGDIHTFTTSDARFAVVGGQLKLVSGVSFNYETEQTINVLVTVTDSANAKFSNNITLLVNDVAEVVVGTNGNDNIYGTIGQDIIYAGAGNDAIIGGLGADNISGGTGTDTVYYTDSTSAVTVSLVAGSANTGGTAQGDVLNLIENIVGSNFNDSLTGDANANVIFGGSGDDIIKGGAGADTIDGEAGIDTASYAGSTATVSIDLLNVTISGGYAEGDTLTNIENLIGSDFADTLVGNNTANNISGGVGNDTLRGNDGNDVLAGGAGSDLVYGGLGNDNINGGSGVDYFSGGAGIDYFAFKALTDSNTTYGIDTITDFQDGTDKIDLSTLDASGISSFADLIITNNGTQTTVADNSSDFAIKLTGVFALDNADFVF